MFQFLFIFILLVLTYIGIFQILPELYWFQSFGYTSTFLIQLLYKTGLFLFFFGSIFLIYFINEKITKRFINASKFTIPNEPTSPFFQQVKKILEALIAPYIGTKTKISASFKWIGLAFLSLLIAKYGVFYWNEIITSLHAAPFQVNDPIFNQDISFFVFLLPVISHFIGLYKFTLITAFLSSIWQYLNQGLLGLFFTPNSKLIRGHVFGFLALIFTLLSFSSYISKFDLLFKNNEIIYGLGYTDFNFYLKAIGVLPWIWLALAVLAIVLIFKLSKPLIVIGAGCYFAFKMIFLSLVPSLIQNYIVAPNEYKKEIPFIKNNIKYTQMAYQLNNIHEVDVAYTKDLKVTNKQKFETIINNARLWNPGPLKSTLKQLQEIRLYYEFKNIDIDRYFINDKPQQVMLSARELDIQQISQKAQTWVNKHLIFTHGYGLCMVPVNQFNAEGLPELFIRDIPPVSKPGLTIKQPELYFGEATNHYVIVNTKQKEFDYPKDNENRYTNYQGQGGIQLDSFLKRLIFSVKLKDIKLLISQNIHDKSRLMFDRNVHLIPKKIAPFIIFDKDPYLVVNNGRLLWMIDGYTSSQYYPYSTPYAKSTNYLRNSVVVTVDAYSGQTKFYIKDASDPIVQAHKNVYPNLFQSIDQMPIDLKKHLRFPKDLFKVITKVYNTYHMNDPQVFYNKEDVWTFPTETYDSETGITMEPYYMYVYDQNSQRHEYVMMVPLTPSNKNNLVSILTASCEPDNFGKITVYKYPKQETVYGPLQIESRIDQNTEISKDLTLWGQVGSRVIRGNLMVIPYDNSIFYIEPIYLQATQSKLPELKRVIVAAGDKVTMTPSLNEGIELITKEKINLALSKNAPQTKTSNYLTNKIIDTYSKVKESLKSSDWLNFGRRFEELDELIQKLRNDQ
ncbi:MAG: UPF0182 family protein [Candidatus Margulisiibacteriota bacterium]